MAANIIMFIWICFLVYHHNSIFPFHNHSINVIRGGILLMVAWMFFATIIFSSIQVCITMDSQQHIKTF